MAETLNEGDLPLADFVSDAAEAIAKAQATLDRESARLMQELAETRIRIPVQTTRIRQKKDEDGNVVSQTSNIETSQVDSTLLAIGVMPTFYAFSKTQIEVAMDISISEQSEERRRETGRPFGLRINTRKLRLERKINKDIKSHSKISVEMVPVAPPDALPDLRQVIIEEE